LKEITKEIIHKTAHIKYNFRIQPVKNEDIIYYSKEDKGSYILWSYPETLDFTRKDTLYVEYSAENEKESYLKGMTFNQDKGDLSCEIGQNGLLRCIVPKSHFDKNEFYFIKYKGEKEFDIAYGKGKIKEYDYYGNLLFEGEYLNGLRNGEGIEYDLGKISFKGNYLNGLRNGYGTEYNIEGKKIYEGEYLKGLRNGKGKEYYSNQILLFDGEYLNGIKYGKVKEYYDNGNLGFEGEYFNGERNGKGKEYNEDGKIIFEGVYLNGLKNGKGIDYDNNGKIEFDGEYIKGERSIQMKKNEVKIKI